VGDSLAKTSARSDDGSADESTSLKRRIHRIPWKLISAVFIVSSVLSLPHWEVPLWLLGGALIGIESILPLDSGSRGIKILYWTPRIAIVIAAPIALFASGAVASYTLAIALVLTIAGAWLGLRHEELCKDWRPAVRALLWTAGILAGTVFIKVGIVQIHHHHKWIGGSSIVLGTTFGVLAFVQERSDSLIKLLVYGFGTTRIVLGVSLVQASDHYLLRGIAAIVAGTAAIVAAKALRPWHGNRLGSALIVTGLATCVGAEGYWADHRMQTGIAVFAFGTAVAWSGVTVLLGRHVGWTLIAVGFASAALGCAIWTEYNITVLAAALGAFGAAVAIGGVRVIGLHEIVSRVRQVLGWLEGSAR
jgi:hypothetical protein